MSIRLKVIESDGTTEQFEFERNTVSIGRAPLNTITLDHKDLPCRMGEFRQDSAGVVVFVCDEEDSSVRHQRAENVTTCSQSSEWEILVGDKILTDVVTIIVEDVAATGGAVLHWLKLPELERQISREERALVDALSHAVEGTNEGTILRAAASMLAVHSDLATSSITLTLVPESTETYAREAFVLNPSASDAQVRRCIDPARQLGAVGLELNRNLSTETYALVRHDQSVEVFLPMQLGGKPAAVLGFVFADASSEQIVQAALVAREIEPLAGLVLQQMRLRTQVESLQAENAYFRERERRHYLFKELICESAAMRKTYREINDRVDYDTPLLIIGEAGSGKELLARAVHHLGGRKSQMMISLNCGALSGPEVDLELFGSISHGLTGASTPRKGVFELARGGTVYLEEIDLLSPLVQGKILRMLTEGEIRRVGDSAGRPVTSRLVCSVHRDLESLVASGKLRRDLYLALKDHSILAPSLRDRPEDIMPLARIFMRNFAIRYEKRCHRIHADVEKLFLEYRWSGNARELQTRIESAVLHCDGEELTAEHFSLVGRPQN